MMSSALGKAHFILPQDRPAKVLVHKDVSVRLSLHCLGFFLFLLYASVYIKRQVLWFRLFATVQWF